MDRQTVYLATFLTTVAALIAIGLVFIYSASSVYALENCGSATYFLRKQLIGFCLGCAAFILVLLLPLRALKSFAPYLFLGALALTLATFVPGIGVSINGARRWLSLGVILFQPSELLKVATVVYLASFLEKKRYQLSSFWHGFVPFLIITILPAGLVLLQPDFGQAATIVATGLALFFVAQGNAKHLIISGFCALLAGGAFIYTKAYRLRRVLTFLNPWNDPRGAGFQIIQSLIAIGSGRFLGLGLMESRQKYFYLPMQHTDFIFSIIAEEMGFVGVLVLVSLFVLFTLSGLRLARGFADPFAALLTVGFVWMISLQALINLCVATGLAPTKGIGLPFVSYGNSALICAMLMIGIVVNAALEEPAYRRGEA